jgi:hypothetical protein
VTDIATTITQEVVSTAVADGSAINSAITQQSINTTIAEDGTIETTVTETPIAVTVVESAAIETTIASTPIVTTISAGLPDAPADGSTYGRKDGGWVAVTVTETDPVFSASAAAGIVAGDITNWDAAFGWGNHAAAGYQSALTFPLSPTLGGTGVNNGTNALTVPATGTAALLGTANVFTTAQTITPGTDVVGLTLDVTATANALQIRSGVTILSGFGADGRLFSNLDTDATNMFLGAGAGNTTMTGTGNTAIGFSAGDAITTGASNMIIGSLAGGALQDGSTNTFIGRSSGRLCVSGGNNTGVGAYTLEKTTSSASTAVGALALQDQTTGQRNTAIGYFAMTNLVSNSFNVAIGYRAAENLAGNNNVVIGYEAGFNLASAGNILIGYEAGYRQTSTANLLIVDNVQRADAATEAQNAFLYGSMAAGGFLQLNIPTTTNNAVKDTLKLQAFVSTASTGAANGFGVGLPFYAETATDATYQQQGLISTSWIDATNATRKAKLSLSAYDTAARLGLEIEADGSAAKLGFYGVVTVARATTGIAEAAFTENAGGTAVNVDSTFGGYTLQQIAQALQSIGILT